MLSIPDMAILGAVALMIFGPDQLPKVARKAGGIMREVQNTSQSFLREMERAADVSEAPVATPPPVWEPPAVPPMAVAEVVSEPRGAGEPYVDPYAAQPHSVYDPVQAPEPAAHAPVIPEPSLPDHVSHPSEPAETAPQTNHSTHV